MGVRHRQALVEQLAAAHRVKGEFLAMPGHGLRNPLSPSKPVDLHALDRLLAGGPL